MSPLILPGLSFAERPLLLAALIEAAQGADRTLDVIVGDRPGIVVLHPADVRTVLGSRAKKGRPASTVQGIRGHITAHGTEFRRKRGAVMAALRAAAAGPLPDGRTIFDNADDHTPPDTATLLLAHLSGAPADPFLTELSVRARAAMRAAITAEGHYAPLARVYTEIEEIVAPSAPFVRELSARNWTTSEITGEIVTLTFAGWASLAAVCRSARTLGLGGLDITASEITELLRIAPPGWLITRESVEPLNLGGRPTPISAGTLLVMSPWLLHRTTTSWTRPTEFDATRHATLKHPSYLPFGAGNRGCPAEQYARAVLHGLLAQQTPQVPSAHPVPSLTDDRSTCLAPQEDRST